MQAPSLVHAKRRVCILSALASTARKIDPKRLDAKPPGFPNVPPMTPMCPPLAAHRVHCPSPSAARGYGPSHSQGRLPLRFWRVSLVILPMHPRSILFASR